MLFLCDVDGVVANFADGFRKNWAAHGLPPFDWKTWDIFDHVAPEHRQHVIPLMSTPGLFRNLEPLPGAIEGVEYLMRRHEVFFCTSPVVGAHHCATEKLEWLEEQFGRDMSKKTILCQDKTVIRGSVLLDDRPDITGVAVPEWEHVIFSAFYNGHITDRKRLEAWDRIEELF